jgi:hypothetical protein
MHHRQMGADWSIGENVPWSSSWTSELRFALARSRDFPGLIEVVQAESQGAGEPLFAAMHVTRQRRAMFSHLCHVCGRPTPTGDRYLFPLQSGFMVPMGDGTVRYGGNVPPVHLACAGTASRLCPHLRKGDSRPVAFPADEGRMVQRTDAVPGLEHLARLAPRGMEIVYACYRLHGADFTATVQALELEAGQRRP